MPDPVIQPTQRRDIQPTTRPQESPADFVMRTMAELPTLTGEQASERLETIRSAIANGTLDPSLETVRLATRSLERHVSADVHANAPSVSTQRRSRSSPRFEGAVRRAFNASNGSGGEFLAALRREIRVPLNPDGAIRQELSRMSPYNLEQTLVSQGASPAQARGIRQSVEGHFARQFEQSLQQHILHGLNRAAQQLNHAASGDELAFETAFSNFVGPGLDGQRMLRALDVVGFEHHEALSSLHRSLGVHPEDREVILERMRPYFVRALQSMADQMSGTLRAAEESFVEDSGTAFEFTAALRTVGVEWGLPRSVTHATSEVLEGQHGSVIAHAVRERIAEVSAANSFVDDVVAEVSGAAVILLQAAGTVLGIARTLFMTVEARHEAAASVAGLSDIADAEDTAARRDLEGVSVLVNRAAAPARGALVEGTVGELPGPIARTAGRLVPRPSSSSHGGASSPERGLN